MRSRSPDAAKVPGVDTCGLWGCGKPANGDRVMIELSDGRRKSIRLCKYHSIMVKDAA